MIELEQLPPMQVLETLDADDIIAERMAKFVELWAKYDPPVAADYDVSSLEFDPIKITEELAAYFELLLRDRINQAAKSVTLAFASGSDLDAIASRYPGGIPRLDTDSDGTADEPDDTYRTRIWLSPNTLSPHGTYEAYVFWAMTAQPALRDATATAVRGTPKVTITIMADGTEVAANSSYTDITSFPSPTPSDDDIDTVLEYVRDESRQGLTDVVYVRAPKITYTDYEVDVWLFPGWDKESTLNSVMKQLAELIEKQRWLGYSHVIAAIEAACMITGIYNCQVISPAADILIEKHEVVVVNSVTVTYKGRGGFEEPAEP
jgi:phage-related baseplate assembly protein